MFFSPLNQFKSYLSSLLQLINQYNPTLTFILKEKQVKFINKNINILIKILN